MAGPIGRLGRLAASNPARVFIAWAVIAVGLGVLAPRVETALSGAGWQANGSESVHAREQIDRDFAGAGGYALQVAVHSAELPGGRAAVPPDDRPRRAACSTVTPRSAQVVPPRPGRSISADGHTAVIRAGAAADPNAMVDAADRAQGRARRRRGTRGCA